MSHALTLGFAGRSTWLRPLFFSSSFFFAEFFFFFRSLHFRQGPLFPFSRRVPTAELPLGEEVPEQSPENN